MVISEHKGKKSTLQNDWQFISNSQFISNIIDVVTANYEQSDVGTKKDVISVEFPENSFQDGDVYEIQFNSNIKANYSYLWLPFNVELKINGIRVTDIFKMIENTWAKGYYGTYLGSRYSIKLQRKGKALHLLSDSVMSLGADDIPYDKLIPGREHNKLLSEVIWGVPITFQLSIFADNTDYYDYMRFSDGNAFKSMFINKDGYLQKLIDLEIK